ncbi:stage II sporulation protein M [Corallococcus exiguus]|uniref:stage II sporulation protein M n=1 Tax=Corallococcus TaxID=83461 RepID=UPI000EC871C3|nr:MULTISPECIES: stage II sporulation protein M [Corallococcus]NNB90422.1 stage II sporulation protein M [Corallococcus exiguus]NNB99240.1 stage II sporulation protein M [Corallococcus exiguus]NNC08014.1 stage II sporulation protein M [Corallococcus exiguus]NPC51912.1 stage II sporulation protein M [Corallococcus exiguus]RKH75464.1 stage II sporulation protein M [Corallococcus sp. AB032C]
MEMAEFIETRRPRWQQLESLLDKSEGEGLRKLSLDEARSLGKLYRAVSSDLLWVRARSGSADVSAYLNDLVGRAYALTYPGRRPRFADVWAFVARGFPALLHHEWRMYVASVLLFLAGAGFGYVGMVVDPDAAHYLVPGQHMSLDPVKRAADEAAGKGMTVEEQAQFTTFLFTHNIQVAFLAFALGVTLGLGTAVMLFVNGLFLGALAQVYAAKGMAGWFWAWILPHGIPEISAICIAGAAGLVIARGMVAPGGLSRGQALRKEAVTAVKMLFGTLVLFVLAGFIEGTVSQIHPPKLSVAFKVGFALTVGTGVYAYLLSDWMRGRRGDVRATAELAG